MTKQQVGLIGATVVISCLIFVGLFFVLESAFTAAPPEPTPTVAPTPTPNIRPYAQLSRSLAVCVFDNPAMHPYFGEAMLIAKNPPGLAMLIELAIETGETAEAEALETLIVCLETQ